MNILKLLKKYRRHRPDVPGQPERLEILLSGSGGQGIILAGFILAEAAALYDNKQAVMTQSYGPEARGGASRAEIIVSSAKIDYPKVIQADILLAMTQEALDKYGGFIGPQGLLIVDETFIKRIPSHSGNVFKAPFTSLAMKLLDAPIVANIIALSSLVAITKVVSRKALIQAVLASVPGRVLVPDRIAVDIGFKVVRDSGFKWETSGSKEI